jgi:hypothetical protein
MRRMIWTSSKTVARGTSTIGNREVEAMARGMSLSE